MSRHGENIRKRKDNRWEGRFIKEHDIAGKARYGSVYGKTYFEVKKKLSDINVLFPKERLHGTNYEITFKEVLFLWLENNRIRLKEQTYAKYLFLSESHLIPDIGDTPIKRIDSHFINHFLEEKSKCGRLDGKGGLSASYIQTLSFIIRAVVEYAAAEGYRQALVGSINRPGKKRNNLEVLSVSEQSVLTKYATDGEHSDRKLGILLSLYTGMRIGEVCGLRWADIDFCANTIHVCCTVERIRNVTAEPGEQKTKLILGEAKTYSSDRIIPIPSVLLKTLAEYSAESDAELVVSGNSYKYTDPRTFQYGFHRFLEDCNLRDINYHVLRHTFATRCIEVGVDIKSLSEMLGHASVNITLNTYVHSSIDMKRQQIEKLSLIYGQ